MARPAQGRVHPVRRRVLDQARVLHPAGERAQRGLRLDPAERSADTVVDAAAEAEVCVVRAIGDEAVGVGEAAGSRLPEASRRTTDAPLGMVTPAMSMSSTVVRVRNCTGGS